MVIDLSQLEIAPWSKGKYGAGFEKPDLSNVVAFGFAVKSRGLRKQGTIELDDIVLVLSDGSGIQAEDFEVSQLSELQSRNVSGRQASWVWGAAALR